MESIRDMKERKTFLGNKVDECRLEISRSWEEVTDLNNEQEDIKINTEVVMQNISEVKVVQKNYEKEMVELDIKIGESNGIKIDESTSEGTQLDEAKSNEIRNNDAGTSNNSSERV